MALGIHSPKIELGVGVSCVRSLAIPTNRFGVVLRHAMAPGIHSPKIELGAGVSCVGSFAIPTNRFRVVLGQALAIVIRSAEAELDLRGSRLGGLRGPVWAMSLRPLLRDADRRSPAVDWSESGDATVGRDHWRPVNSGRCCRSIKNSFQRYIRSNLNSSTNTELGAAQARYVRVMPDGKIPFDPGEPDLDAVRRIVFERLRHDRTWEQLDEKGEKFAPFVDYAPTSHVGPDGQSRLASLAHEVFWQLVVEGVLAPGDGGNNFGLPRFHITAYGSEVLKATELQPYDPSGYLARVREDITNADATVVAYLAESLETFRKGNLVASTVMLGIAAERVFLLLCGALCDALSKEAEKTEFEKLLHRFQMKPKLDWVDQKIRQIQNQGPAGIPGNATIMLVTIYDLMRCQRNELGHPREIPPNVKRKDAFVNLQIFPRFYETAEDVRKFLKTNRV